MLLRNTQRSSLLMRLLVFRRYMSTFWISLLNTMKKKLIIAIDGYVATGKGTTAKGVAKAL